MMRGLGGDHTGPIKSPLSGTCAGGGWGGKLYNRLFWMPPLWTKARKKSAEFYEISKVNGVVWVFCKSPLEIGGALPMCIKELRGMLKQIRPCWDK